MTVEPLFYKKGELRRFLDQRKNALEKEILSYDPNQILNVSEEDFCEYMVSKYSLDPPELVEKDKYAEPQEVDVDVSRDPMRPIIDRSRPFYIKGLQLTIIVPFNGDGNLFQYRPSRYGTNPPRAEVAGQQLRLIYETTKYDAERIKSEYQNAIERINGYLESVRRDVEQYLSQIRQLAKELIPRRKEKILADLEMVSVLEIPIRRREDIPQTYASPVRKRLKIARPVPSAQSFKPEPTLSEEVYEEILDIIFNMTRMMERSPRTFSKLDEEEIRDHFLIHLNGRYEGQATGETFNCQGRTDILIRCEDKNIFIAECKIWRGDKGFLETINQLLGYTSWRDTKTAILIFNRNRDLSSVLGRIDKVIKAHDCYKREHKLESSNLDKETTFSYIFHQPGDKNRELKLTVLVFDVPGL